VPVSVNGYLVGTQVAIVIETESTYVTMESTLRSDDVGVVLGLFLLQTSHMLSRKRSGRWPGNEATLPHSHVNIPDC